MIINFSGRKFFWQYYPPYKTLKNIALRVWDTAGTEAGRCLWGLNFYYDLNKILKYLINVLWFQKLCLNL